MSSADEPASTPEPTGSELNPMEGGRWRPVRPDELLRKPGPDDDDRQRDDQPRVLLERRQELEHHLKSNPADLESFLELGQIYRDQNRHADARRVLQQALEIFPDEESVRWEYEEAVLARSLQQLREVKELAQRVQTPEADRELERSQSDWACRRMEVCRARLKRDPSLVHLNVILAEALYDAGSYQEAFDELEPVLSNDEHSPSAHLIRGRCLLEMGKDTEAMVALRASALRRAVVAPPRTRVLALRMLCDAAERLGLTLTLAQYRQHLQKAEKELAEQTVSPRQESLGREDGS